MKPEDLLDPAEFPDDLKWIPAHYRLHPADPVYLLLAWHWRRVKQSEDTLKAAIVELKSALDVRIKMLAEVAEPVNGINQALTGMQHYLEEKPAQLGAEFETKLAQPVAHAVAQLQAMEQSLAPLTRTFQVAQRRQLLAVLLVGVALGVLSAVIAGLA